MEGTIRRLVCSMEWCGLLCRGSGGLAPSAFRAIFFAGVWVSGDCRWDPSPTLPHRGLALPTSVGVDGG